MSVAIYGAVAGGHGDTLENLSRNPEEGRRWARVRIQCKVINGLKSNEMTGPIRHTYAVRDKYLPD